MDLRVWVGCLAHYNNGELIGEWIDAEDAGEWVCPKRNPNDIYINCEEYQVMDHEMPWISGELSTMEAVAWAEAVARISDYETDAFVAWLKHAEIRDPADATYRAFQDAYSGAYESPKDHAHELMEGFQDGKEIELPSYFQLEFNETDWQQDFSYVDGHVFWNHS